MPTGEAQPITSWAQLHHDTDNCILFRYKVFFRCKMWIRIKSWISLLIRHDEIDP